MNADTVFVIIIDIRDWYTNQCMHGINHKTVTVFRLKHDMYT